MSIGPEREQEPDDDSVEDVLETLRAFEQDLVEHGVILPDERIEPRVFTGYISPVVDMGRLLDAASEEASLETGSEEFAEYVASLRTMLTSIGLADPGSVVPEEVMDVSPDILEQLDSLNAEALFYDVARRVHKELGPHGQVTWARLLERAMPAQIDGTQDEATDLDKLRMGQSLDNTGDLGNLGIRLTVAPIPDKQQNINRLTYVYYEEPSLDKLRRALQRLARREEFYMTMEKAIAFAKKELDKEIGKLAVYRQALEEQAEEQRMDSIDQEIWERHSKKNRAELRRVRSSLNIIKIMIESMGIRTIRELNEALSRENGIVSSE